MTPELAPPLQISAHIGWRTFGSDSFKVHHTCLKVILCWSGVWNLSPSDPRSTPYHHTAAAPDVDDILGPEDGGEFLLQQVVWQGCLLSRNRRNNMRLNSVNLLGWVLKEGLLRFLD
ncbi:hypothetical protein AVEN_175906-1 [Araneus ventricosus]|uniref:Uncharacterized protein n=1 Tax=Araneus ventricosus TaxID=182803 RepID=A0A4Y2EFV4_ARAVE|nr:hypothetical protein AVEN_175906-1 [Araneus ventricosus]